MNIFSVPSGAVRRIPGCSTLHGSCFFKGIWSWAQALMWPIRFLGQHSSSPCMAYCLSQICGTRLLHCDTVAGVQQGQVVSEFTLTLSSGDFMWCKSGDECWTVVGISVFCTVVLSPLWKGCWGQTLDSCIPGCHEVLDSHLAGLLSCFHYFSSVLEHPYLCGRMLPG